MDASSNLQQVLSWQNITVILIIYWATLIYYRIFLHPLAHFPGPRLAAITRWYEAYFDVVENGQYTFKIAKLHKKYGTSTTASVHQSCPLCPIVRISPHELHVIDPNFFEKLYRQDGRWDKYAWAIRAFPAPGSIINTGPHDLHKTRRLALNHFFSKAKVASQQELIHCHVQKLCDRITSFSATTFDLGAALSAVTRDVSSDFILNKTYGALDKEDFHVAVTNMFQRGGGIWRVTKHVPWFGPAMLSIPVSLMTYLVDEGTKAFFQYIEESQEDTKNLLRIATAPSAEEEAPRTIVHEIVDSKLPQPEKAFTRVMDDVATITGAGFETTASVLRVICYHIFSDSNILQQLRAELTSTINSESRNEDKVELRTLEQLPYLTSVVMEGLRLSPAVGSRAARIAPDRDLFYNGIRIPAGTPVGMTTILMHHDETLYPSPQSFNPQRWMDPESRRMLDKTYAPFSRGTRICLGMHLAWAELYLVIAALVQHFDFKFQGVDSSDFVMESDQFIIGTKAGAVLKAQVTSYKTAIQHGHLD